MMTVNEARELTTTGRKRIKTKNFAISSRAKSPDIGKSSAYELGYALTKEARLGGISQKLRQLLQTFTRGAGRGVRTRQMKGLLGGDEGGLVHGLGRFTGEHPHAALLGGGLTLAQLNDLLTNMGQGSAIRGLQTGK